MHYQIRGWAVIILMSGFFLGCSLKWEPHWQKAGVSRPGIHSEALLEDAQSLFEQAGDKNSLLDSISAYHRVISLDPRLYEALAMLSNQYILLGTAYTHRRAEKSQYFRRAMKLAELAMYTNLSFRKRVDNGQLPWEAATTLGHQEMTAMLFWVTAVQYEFKECMTLLEKIVNIGWLKRGLIFLNHIEKLDPNFGGGAVEFGKVICYYALPESMGGSKTKGDVYMARAAAKKAGWMLPIWARGKYYYVIKGNQEKSKKDLEWVAAQDLEMFKDPFPWKVHFQKDARDLLRGY